MKYKIGDILKIININECGSAVKHKAVYAKIALNIQDTSYAYYLLDANKNVVDFCSCLTDNDLELIERTIEEVREGDKIVDTKGYICEVLSVSGQMVFTTLGNRAYTEATYGDDDTVVFTIKELMGKGYKILQEPKTVEMTVAEVAEKLGLKGKLKIKE